MGHRVQDATLDIRRGEIVGLAGLLGSGRTETARAIFAADRKTAGTVTFNGKPAEFTGPADAIAAGMGFCSEDRKIEGIVPDMSVRENLTLALLPALTRSGVVDEAKQREIVERFIKELGIKCSGPEQKIRELSGGNQQKVLLARWLCMNPKLLILDEPTRGIDVGAKAEIQALIRRLAERGARRADDLLRAGGDRRGRGPRLRAARRPDSAQNAKHASITEAAVMPAMAHGATHAATLSEKKPMTRSFDRAAFFQRYGVALALILLIVFNLVVTPNFATLQTFAVNLTQVCTIVIVGVGMTLVIATGGIDLSVGSLMAIAGALSPLIFLGKLFPLPQSLCRHRSRPSSFPFWSPACSGSSTAG